MRFARKRLAVFTLILTGLTLLPFGAAAAQGETQGGVFGDFEVSPGERVEIPVEIRGVTELYAVDLEIRFDPDIVQIEDANPNLDGVQPALGTFLDAGLTLFNNVDNDEGVIRFVMSQVNPSEPKSGEGVLLVLYVLGVDQGASDMAVTKLELSDRFGEAIPVEAMDGVISVSEGAAVSQSTAIPVQDPTGMIPVPTQVPPASEPTSAAPTPSPTQAAQDSEQVSGDNGVAPEPTTEDTQEEVFVPVVESGSPEAIEETRDGFMLLDYWWIVLIVVLAVIGAAGYLLVIKK